MPAKGGSDLLSQVCESMDPSVLEPHPGTFPAELFESVDWASLAAEPATEVGRRFALVDAEFVRVMTPLLAALEADGDGTYFAMERPVALRIVFATTTNEEEYEALTQRNGATVVVGGPKLGVCYSTRRAKVRDIDAWQWLCDSLLVEPNSGALLLRSEAVRNVHAVREKLVRLCTREAWMLPTKEIKNGELARRGASFVLVAPGAVVAARLLRHVGAQRSSANRAAAEAKAARILRVSAGLPLGRDLDAPATRALWKDLNSKQRRALLDELGSDDADGDGLAESCCLERAVDFATDFLKQGEGPKKKRKKKTIPNGLERAWKATQAKLADAAAQALVDELDAADEKKKKKKAAKKKKTAPTPVVEEGSDNDDGAPTAGAPPSQPAAAASSSVQTDDADSGLWHTVERRRPSKNLCSKLSGEIAEMAAALRSIAQLRESYQLGAAARLRAVATRLWPNAAVQVYGSVVTGLAVPGSDVDVVISRVPTWWWSTSPKQQPMNALASELRLESWVSNAKTVGGAVPLVKAETAAVPTRHGNRSIIKIDISFDVAPETAAEASSDSPNDRVSLRHYLRYMEDDSTCQDTPSATARHGGVANTLFVLKLRSMHPQLAPLVLVLKQLLYERGLNDPYTGGLSSYALVIMVAAVLQTHALKPPNVRPDLGALFLDLLAVYGTASLDPRRSCVTIRADGTGPLAPLTPAETSSHVPRVGTRDYWRPADPVVIQDPVDPLNNIGKNCFGFRQVQLVFDEARRAILNAPATSLLGAAFQTQHHNAVVKHLQAVWCPCEVPTPDSDGEKVKEEIEELRALLNVARAVSSTSGHKQRVAAAAALDYEFETRQQLVTRIHALYAVLREREAAWSQGRQPDLPLDLALAQVDTTVRGCDAAVVVEATSSSTAADLPLLVAPPADDGVSDPAPDLESSSSRQGGGSSATPSN